MHAPGGNRRRQRERRPSVREAGLRWLRQRRKTWVPQRSRKHPLTFKDRVKASSDQFLRRWVYTDGIGFYKDRTQDELDELKHKALGIYVWRGTKQEEALYKDCVGPSSYRKAQGQTITV